ncbi:glycosyltransferase family 2 protein [Algibacter pacificus]|uniref:glycosyltransferase family 2 protein n=1 Tax=Algibacter pacificus TaxID=2599389 RepID=UPI0011CA14A9|nr:glycosyltransferase family 2 protein [Algibacter pacificus]
MCNKYDKIYIVIVTYNGMPWLQKCLDSCKDYPVIVVDNNSKDGTVSFIENNYSKIKLFKQSFNLGFGQANNLGISFALKHGANHVFLLNQDAYIVDDCLAKLVWHQKNNPEYGVLSPIHLNGEGSKLDRLFSHYLSYDYNETFYFDAIKNKLYPIYQVPFVNAAAWLLSKNTLDKIGGFDPLFFHYGEDVNYCQRLNYHGFKVGVVTSTFIMHDRERVLDQKNVDYNSIKEKEKQYKIRWANVNIESQTLIYNRIEVLKKRLFKSYLKFSFKIANNCKAELRLIKRIKEGIYISRTINKKLGKHYIE